MDRRQKAEDDFRQKFNDAGLSDRFDFIGRDWSKDHGRQVFVRCKSCGSEFRSYGVIEIFKHHQKRLSCPECGASSDGNDIFIRSDLADEVMLFYTMGHSVTETAERFNIPTCQVNNLAKKRCLSNGRTFRDAGNERARQQSEDAEQRLAEQLAEIDFEYVGGYHGKESRVAIRCRRCGTEYERCVEFLRTGNPICTECQKRRTAARQEAMKRIEQNNAKVRQVERLWYRLTHPPKDPYAEQHEAFLNKSGICEICGKPYTVREYVESCGLKKAQDNGVCSDECRKAKLKLSKRASHRGRRDSHRHRAVKFGCEYDSSLTLEKLIKRKGLRCAICGGMCDLNDHTWSEYCGPMYPSIDHIIPMSKGGSHTWENVQVAHIICNSQKSNKVVCE